MTASTTLVTLPSASRSRFAPWTATQTSVSPLTSSGTVRVWLAAAIYLARFLDGKWRRMRVIEPAQYMADPSWVG